MNGRELGSRAQPPAIGEPFCALPVDGARIEALEASIVEDKKSDCPRGELIAANVMPRTKTTARAQFDPVSDQ